MDLKENSVGPGRLSMLLPYLLLALVLAVTTYVRIRLLDVPLERDEGEYAYMGQLLLKGAPPYLYAYSMKLPGVSAVYALFMSVFGQTPFGIHLGLLLANAISACLVYQLGARLISRNAAVLSCASFALLSLSKTVYGPFAHATQFVIVFALAGFVLLLRPAGRNRAALLFLSGLCFGLAFIMKQPAALFVIFAFLYLGCEAWQHRTPVKTYCLHGLLFLTGIAIPYGLVLFLVFQGGSLENFWFWTVSYASAYASGPTLDQGLDSFLRSF